MISTNFYNTNKINNNNLNILTTLNNNSNSEDTSRSDSHQF